MKFLSDAFNSFKEGAASELAKSFVSYDSTQKKLLLTQKCIDTAVKLAPDSSMATKVLLLEHSMMIELLLDSKKVQVALAPETLTFSQENFVLKARHIGKVNVDFNSHLKNGIFKTFDSLFCVTDKKLKSIEGINVDGETITYTRNITDSKIARMLFESSDQKTATLPLSIEKNHFSIDLNPIIVETNDFSISNFVSVFLK